MASHNNDDDVKENTRMQRRSWKRATAVLAGLAIMGAGSVALAPSATAATTVEANLAVTGTPDIIVRGDGQTTTGTTLVVNLDEATVAGDTIDIRVRPSSTDCGANDGPEAIGFGTATEIHPDVTLTFHDECDGDTNNILRLTFGGVVTDNSDIVISGVTYNVRPQAPSGRIELVLGADPEVPGNAIVAATDRIDGEDRFETAALIAAASTADGCAEDVVLVSGRNFPDALAAAFLGRPILLTEPNALSPFAQAALEDMGAKNVTIVGGTDAVSSPVYNALAALDEGTCGADIGLGKVLPVRVAGPNRYATARAVVGNTQAGTLDDGLNDCNSEVRTAILTSGENFPDALAAGPLAYNGNQTCGAGRIPIILTTPGTPLRPEAQEAINAVGAQQVVILGGELAISGAVQTQVEALPGVNTMRIDGPTRWDTAIEFAEILRDPDQGFGGEFLLANGENFPDALAGGPLGGFRSAPILLSQRDTLHAGTANTIRQAADVLDVTLLGGPVALGANIVTGVNNAFLARNS